jgi:hypothetical protein
LDAAPPLTSNLVKRKEEMTKETLMTQQTIDHFGASDSIGRANSNYLGEHPKPAIDDHLKTGHM